MKVCYISTNLNNRIDKSIINQAEEIFNKLGLNMFLRTTIREHGIPFELKLDIPNKTTIDAIDKVRRMMADPTTPKYSSIDELIYEI